MERLGNYTSRYLDNLQCCLFASHFNTCQLFENKMFFSCSIQHLGLRVNFHNVWMCCYMIIFSYLEGMSPIIVLQIKVYVAGLPWKATEEVLRKDFEECGEIAKIHLLKDMETKKFKGVMFVTYKSQAGVDLG